MKIQLILIVCLISMGIRAQSIFVKEYDGSQKSYSLTSIKKLTFPNDSLAISLYDGNDEIYPLNNVSVIDMQPNVYTQEQSVVICSGDSYSIGNSTYSTAGYFVDILLAENGFDSIVYTNLNIENIDNTVQLLNDTTLMVANAPGLSYQWYNCEFGDEVIGATNNTFTPTSIAPFYVVINSANCFETSICVSISDLASLNEIEKEMSIDVFPNPTNGIIYIKSNLLIDKISILDMKGITINTFNENFDIIDLGHLSKGVYFLVIENDKNKINKRVVIE